MLDLVSHRPLSCRHGSGAERESQLLHQLHLPGVYHDTVTTGTARPANRLRQARLDVDSLRLGAATWTSTSKLLDGWMDEGPS